MRTTERIKAALIEPEVRGCEMDDARRFDAHRAVLARKPLIRDVFTEIHRAMRQLDERLLRGEGSRIELGAGVFPIRESFAEVIATDVVDASHLDRVLDAEAMDVPDQSVRAFYLQNVFHHFPHPSRFFSELERTLVPGGGAIIVEPHAGPLASWLYPRLFSTERYDKGDPAWESIGSGPMTGANQALSAIIFDRDLARFRREHPMLEVAYRDVLSNWLRYLASGGLNFRPLIPPQTACLVRGIESMLSPVRRWLGLHRVLVLRRVV